jgi:hypothetical protein
VLLVLLKEQKNKQHNDQKNMTEGQATQSPKENDRRTSNTMSFSLGHCFASPFVIFLWPLCCLSFCPFLLVIMLLVLRQATQSPKENDRRTSNTMAKKK